MSETYYPSHAGPVVPVVSQNVPRAEALFLVLKADAQRWARLHRRIRDAGRVPAMTLSGCEVQAAMLDCGELQPLPPPRPSRVRREPVQWGPEDGTEPSDDEVFDGLLEQRQLGELA